MDKWFSMEGVVTPLIQFCRVILLRTVKPYCSQSFFNRSFMVFSWRVLLYGEYYRSTSHFQDSWPSLWRGCINSDPQILLMHSKKNTLSTRLDRKIRNDGEVSCDRQMTSMFCAVLYCASNRSKVTIFHPSIHFFVLFHFRRFAFFTEAATLRSIVQSFFNTYDAGRDCRTRLARPLTSERGQGNVYFPCSVDHVKDWQPYPVDP